jgi:hypothetical protein
LAASSSPRLLGFQTVLSARELFYGWLAATLLSGIPSSLHTFVTGNDLLEATRAAGAMLLPGETTMLKLLVSAALVHSTISAFWAVVLAITLPRLHITLSAIAASAVIAVLDLRVIAPAFFPEIAALDFWPQFADHLMWGASFGIAVEVLNKKRTASGVVHR